MHYVGDVLVGTFLGAAILAAAWRFVGDEPARGFALAALISVGALVVSSLSAEALLAFDGSVGGTVGSLQLDALEKLRSRLEGFVLSGIGVPFVFLVDELAEGTRPSGAGRPSRRRAGGRHLASPGVRRAPATCGRPKTGVLRLVASTALFSLPVRLDLWTSPWTTGTLRSTCPTAR